MASPTSKVQFQENHDGNDNNNQMSEKEQKRLQMLQQLERYNQPVVSVPALLRRVGNHIELVTKGETSSEIVRRKLQLQHEKRSLSAQPTANHGEMKKKEEGENDEKEKEKKEGSEKGDDDEDKKKKENGEGGMNEKKKAKGVGPIHDAASVNPLQGRAKNESSVSTFLKGLGGERVKDVVQRRHGGAGGANSPSSAIDNTTPPSHLNTSASVASGTTTATTNSGNKNTLEKLEAIKMNDEMIKFLEAQTAFDYEIVVNNNNNDKKKNSDENDNDDDDENYEGLTEAEKKKKKELEEKLKERREKRQITDPKLRREIIKQAILHLQKTNPGLAAVASNMNFTAGSGVGAAGSESNGVLYNNNNNNSSNNLPSSSQLQALKKEFRKAVQASIKDYVSARKSQQLDTLFQMLSKITRPDGFYKMHTPIGDGAFGQTHLVEWVPAAANKTSTNEDENTKKEGGDEEEKKKEEGGATTTTTNNHEEQQKAQNVSGAAATSPNGVVDEVKQFRIQAASNPAGAVSYLSCSRQFIPGADGTRIPRERAFVCKMESRNNATRRSNIVGTGQSEQRTLANCAHPNIVSFVDRFSDSYNYYLIMEFVDGTDLREEVKRRAARNPPKLFSISSVLFLFVQTLLGVEYLHRHNILHRDLKTANILISFKWQVKICDLGFAKEYIKDTDGDNNSITALGTPYYMSPEILNGDPYGEKVDMWSLGIILYEILSLQRPFTHADAEVIAERILNTEAVPVTEYRKDIPPELIVILNQLMNKDPKMRPSAKDILKTPIFTHAVEDYINKMRTMAMSAGSAIDKWWVQVLEDHQRLVCDDYKSAQKSRNAERQERRTAMSMTGTKFLHTTMAQ